MNISEGDFPLIEKSHDRPPHIGHAHFWERAALSRRSFIKTTTGVTGAVLASGLWMPTSVLADGAATPRPIPGGVAPGLHLFLPAPGFEASTITDFHGGIGVAHLGGTGKGINTDTGKTRHLLFDVDVRFMQGTFIATDGHQHHGTFAFI